MTEEHFERVLHIALGRQPFRVFTVELNGGPRLEIDHPRAVVLTDGVAVFLAPTGIPVWFDHESVKQILDAPATADLAPEPPA